MDILDYSQTELRDLVASIMVGDEEAEEQFFAATYPWVLRQVRRGGISELEAEDVAQDILWELFQQVRQGDCPV